MAIKYKFGRRWDKQIISGSIGARQLHLKDEYKNMTLNQIAKKLKEYYELKNIDIELLSINFSISEYKKGSNY